MGYRNEEITAKATVAIGRGILVQPTGASVDGVIAVEVADGTAQILGVAVTNGDATGLTPEPVEIGVRTQFSGSFSCVAGETLTAGAVVYVQNGGGGAAGTVGTTVVAAPIGFALAPAVAGQDVEVMILRQAVNLTP